MRRVVLLAAMAVCAASSAWAQSAEPSAPGAVDPASQAQRFQAYATHEGYKQMVGQLALMGDTISFPDCKTRKPVARNELIIFAPPVFAEGLHPVSGLWKDQIKMDHCGSPGYQNVLIRAQNNGQPPQVALMMPGLSATNSAMQNLIMTDFLKELGDKHKCTDQTKILPVDTKLEKETKPRKLDQNGMLVEGAWKETWMFRACGKDVKASVDLQADGKGGLGHKVKVQ
jgi:hypothetical protein